MEWFNILMARLRALFRRESVLQDIEEELRVHVEMETGANIERGMPPDEARAAALKSFGNPGRKTELGYDIRGGGWLETLWQDLRYGARMLSKNPGFTLIAVITLALGIGAKAAIFSVINGVYLSPLAYHEPEQLMMIWEKLPRTEQVELSPTDYEEYENRNQAFAQMGAAEGANLNLTGGGGEPVHVDGQAATASLFPLLGVQPLLGRTFTKEEDDANAPVVVLSHRLWQSHFAGNAAILNQTIRLNDKSYTVIGVMPPEFQYPPPVRQAPIISDLWVPRSLATETRKLGDFDNLKWPTLII